MKRQPLAAVLFLILAAAACGEYAGASQPTLDQAGIVRDLGAYLDQLVKDDAFSGTVLVARNGKPLFQHAYGLASRAFNVPNRLDTKFNLGSMNKMFTGVAIAQLAQAGKLAFTDTLAARVPDYPDKDLASKVTIHQLLTHTSGMGSYFNDKYIQSGKERFRTVRDYFPLIVGEPLAFTPGSKWSYSNSGFMVLGAVIEAVSGQNYFDYVREHIYAPAGMQNTDAYEMDTDTPNLAIGYTQESDDGSKKPGPRRNNLFMHVVKGGPAGGGFSTVEDLLKFDVALRGHRLLNEEMTNTVWTGKVETGRAGSMYAYGFGDSRIDGQRIVGHSGGFNGINSQLDMYLDSGYTVAVMSNYDPPAAQNVARKARELLKSQK